MFLSAVDVIDNDLSPSTRRRVKTTYAPSNIRDFAANRDALDKVIESKYYISKRNKWNVHLVYFKNIIKQRRYISSLCSLSVGDGRSEFHVSSERDG